MKIVLSQGPDAFLSSTVFISKPRSRNWLLRRLRHERNALAATLEMTNTDLSTFPTPSMLPARLLGYNSSVGNSSNVCSSCETECIHCAISTHPFIDKGTTGYPQSCGFEMETFGSFELSTTRNCLRRIPNSQERSCSIELDVDNLFSKTSEDLERYSSSSSNNSVKYLS